MYNYVTDKQLISSMRSLSGNMMQDLCHILKEKYDIGAMFTLVGSGARNLILQNANEPIDLDYNLKIKINYICLFDYLFIYSQMSAKPYFIGSTGILLLW